MTLPEHAICSVMLAQFGVRQKLGTSGVVLVTIAGIAPDFDVVSKLFGDVYFWELHHALGHSVISIVVLSLLIAMIGKFLLGIQSFVFLWGWCLAAAAVHCATDALYWFAVKPFWPMSDFKIELRILEYLDLIVLALWIVGAWFLYKRQNKTRVATITLSIFAVYVGARAILPAPNGILKLITGGWMYAAPEGTPVLDWW